MLPEANPLSTHLLVLLGLILLAGNLLANGSTVTKTWEDPEKVVVFQSGEGGYHTYRIPALIVTKKGTLLAFCEGRKNGRGDSGEINALLRRSFDGGRTWGPMQKVAVDGPNTFGNPCPVIDRDTGTIWLPLTHNIGEDHESEIKMGTGKGTRTVWICKSTDDGATWTTPVEITASTKKKNWAWYATGPGVGIQLKSGRLVIPCDYALLGTRDYGSHVIYSDDSGETWKIGGEVFPQCNECQVVELEDGSLMLNMRSYRGQYCRSVAISKDQGLTFSEGKPDETLVEPVCQGSFIRYTEAGTHGKSRLLFSNPASIRRNMMTARMSYDEGKTWPVMKLLDPRFGAYSCLTVLPDMDIGLLYECGPKDAYETITFARFGLDWLTDGKDKLK